MLKSKTKFAQIKLFIKVENHVSDLSKIKVTAQILELKIFRMAFGKVIFQFAL